MQELRALKHLTQQELADSLGIKKATYGTWERGERMMSLGQAYAVTEALGCTLDELVGREPSHDGLRADERRLLASYGALDGEGRGRAVDYVDYLATRHAAGEGGLPERLAS